MSNQMFALAIVITTVIYLQILSLVKINHQKEIIEHQKMMINSYKLIAQRYKKRKKVKQ